MTVDHSSYIGRFAPSPTGPLHLGSLIAALASYLDAKANQGQWLVRMEDLDPPRETPGAADSILRSLEQHGLHWDGNVLYQSTQLERYHAIINDLIQRELAFYCTCSRRESEAMGGIYNGRCRDTFKQPDQDFAVRLRVDNRNIFFTDKIQGLVTEQLDTSIGDFVILRKDGLTAYQLAVVVDDAQQGITTILRGSDLLDSTPRQLFLQNTLGLATPAYAHIPVITDDEGNKFSKQTFAEAVDDQQAINNLRLALRFLNQPQPAQGVNLQDFLLSATDQWQLSSIPANHSIKASSIKQP